LAIYHFLLSALKKSSEGKKCSCITEQLIQLTGKTLKVHCCMMASVLETEEEISERPK
jgi:hypothetical protein